jgi:hypothetical protein
MSPADADDAEEAEADRRQMDAGCQVSDARCQPSDARCVPDGSQVPAASQVPGRQVPSDGRRQTLAASPVDYDLSGIIPNTFLPCQTPARRPPAKLYTNDIIITSHHTQPDRHHPLCTPTYYDQPPRHPTRTPPTTTPHHRPRSSQPGPLPPATYPHTPSSVDQHHTAHSHSTQPQPRHSHAP